MTISIRVVEEGARFAEIPLSVEGPCAVRLRSLPGTSALHLSLFQDGTLLLRAEIAVDGEETVTTDIDFDEGGHPHVSSSGRKVFIIPAKEGLEPTPPIVAAESEEDLDLLLVIDGTLRLDLQKQLLASAETWEKHVELLESFCRLLSKDLPDPHFAVLAFGDQEMPDGDVSADELQPSYRLHPHLVEDRQLRAMSVEQLGKELRTVPATSGGDLVDALADALHAASELRWRPKARKLVIVVGDSPGHSTEHPIHPEADVCVRSRDVDVVALELHKKGIEIVTVYFDPLATKKLRLRDPELRRILDRTRRQYRRLASLPEMAFEASELIPDKAAAAVLKRPELLARGSAYGKLLEVVSRES